MDSSGYARSSVRGLWRVSSVGTDDQTIAVTVANGGCLYLTHMTVEINSDSAVELAAWNDQWQPVKDNYGCTADLRYVRARFRLPEPLNGRVLEGQCVPGDSTVAARQCPDDFFVVPPTTNAP